MSSFQLLDQVVKTAADAGVDGNGSFNLYVSPEQPVTGGATSVKVIMNYDLIVPEFGANPQTFDIDAHVEGKNGTQWFTLANQFSPARNKQQGPQRIIVMAPTVSGGDAGVDNVVHIGDNIASRLSLTYGEFGAVGIFRVCIVVTERGHGGLGAFQQVTLDVFGETYA